MEKKILKDAHGFFLLGELELQVVVIGGGGLVVVEFEPILVVGRAVLLDGREVGTFRASGLGILEAADLGK